MKKFKIEYQILTKRGIGAENHKIKWEDIETTLRKLIDPVYIIKSIKAFDDMRVESHEAPSILVSRFEKELQEIFPNGFTSRVSDLKTGKEYKAKVEQITTLMAIKRLLTVDIEYGQCRGYLEAKCLPYMEDATNVNIATLAKELNDFEFLHKLYHHTPKTKKPHQPEPAVKKIKTEKIKMTSATKRTVLSIKFFRS